MDIDIEQFKEWVSYLSDFTWPVVIVVVVFVYRDAVIYLFKAIIDVIFRRK